MKIFIIFLLLWSSTIFADGGKRGRTLAQSDTNQPIPCGTYICKITSTVDDKTGFKSDVLSVYNSHNDKICSYIAEPDDEFWSVQALSFSQSPNRYLLTVWQKPRVWEYKILDTSKPGDVCSFWGPNEKDKSGRIFTGDSIDSYPPSQKDPVKDDLDIDCISQKHPEDPDSTAEIVKRTNCALDEKKMLRCIDYKPKAYP